MKDLLVNTQEKQNNQNKQRQPHPPGCLREIAGSKNNLRKERLFNLQLGQQVGELWDNEREQEDDEARDDSHYYRGIQRRLPNVRQHLVHPIQVFF